MCEQAFDAGEAVFEFGDSRVLPGAVGPQGFDLPCLLGAQPIELCILLRLQVAKGFDRQGLEAARTTAPQPSEVAMRMTIFE